MEGSAVQRLLLGNVSKARLELNSVAITPSERAKKRLHNFVPGLCLFLAGLAALAFSLYPMYVIRPFREQEPVPLARALWVQLHDKAILFAMFALITILALLVWRRLV